MNTSSGMLYIVGTPVGNLEDMSFRAIRILKEVDLIAAEDTRHTRVLLDHFEINTPTESYHKFSEKSKIPKIIENLLSGKNIALVSDAGMPGISDPGELLIKEAVKNHIYIIPVPGPSALILALSSSGLSTERFIFEGFLPRKESERMQRLYALKDETRTAIFYEAGNRIADTICDMKNILGNRECVIARELTKKFEEIKRGNFDNIMTKISSTKGEFVILVGGSQQKDRKEISLKEEIEGLQKQLGISAKEAIKLTAVKLNLPKREVYSEWIRKNSD
jgi:16S rRNA (cytidine1402-2'-O)-methyltransferase